METEQKNKEKIVKIFIILVIAFSTVKLILDSVMPIFDELCADKAKSIATIVSNEQSTEVMKDHTYDELFTIEKDNDGNVIMIKSNIVKINENTLTIEEILPRKNELDRPVVSNVDIALIVTSVKKPDLSLSLLDKELSVVLANNIKPVICLTKLDLLSKKELKELKPLIKYYKKIGVLVTDNNHLGKLKKILKNNLVVLTGQTGAGKSSLLNKLDKKLNLETKPISDALNRGVHTTRHTEIYKIGKIYFVDTPGFSALDLKNIDSEKLKETFLEFNKYNCDFKNCNHLKEKECKVIDAVSKGEILPSRYINYTRFIKECHENNRKLYK